MLGLVCLISATVTESRSTPTWDVSLDRGGTFTDVVATSDEGITVCSKVLSGPGCEAAAVGRLTEEHGGKLGRLRIGTTVGTKDRKSVV